MADGREFVEEAYQILAGVSGRLEELQAKYSAEELAELEGAINGCTKWAKLCRGKVWLRSAEGTSLANGCLAAANQLKENLDKPATAIDMAMDLSTQLESLARLIATKAQVIT